MKTILYPLKIFITLVFVTSFIASMAQVNLQWQPREDLSAGLPPSVKVYETFTPLPGGAALHALYTEVDLTDPNIGFEAVYVGDGNTFRTPLDFAQSSGDPVYVAINGGFFSGSQSVSLVTQNGEVLVPNIKAVSRDLNGTSTTYFPTRSAFGILGDGQADVAWIYNVGAENTTYAYPMPSPNVLGTPPQPQPDEGFPAGGALWNESTAIGGGPVIISGGAVNVTSGPELLDPNSNGREPRTAIGYTADNKVIMIVVDGRQPEFSLGITLPELGEVLLDLGVVEAVNLDGGGSSAMVVDNQLVSSPSDAGNVQRRVPTALLLKRTPQLWDTEDNTRYSETGSWFETANPGFFGPSRARLVGTGDGSSKAIYTLAGLPPAEYEVSGWWVPAFNRSTNTPYTAVRSALNARDTVRVNQTQGANQFNLIGTFHLGPADSIVVSNDAQGSFVTVDAIQLTKVGESLPMFAFDRPEEEDIVRGANITLNVDVLSPNTGVTLETLKIFKTVGDGVEEPFGTNISLGQALKETYTFNYTVNDPLGTVDFRFEAGDNFGRTVSKTYRVNIKSFAIEFNPPITEAQHPSGRSFSIDLEMDTQAPGVTLMSLEVFKSVDDTGEEQVGNIVPFDESREAYTFSYFVNERATSTIRFRFLVKASDGSFAEKFLHVNVIPARGDFRIAVISDFNASFGSTNYEFQVDSIIRRIPRLWAPDLVVSGGDMVAGQSRALTEPELQAMWDAFEVKIAEPLRNAGIPFMFTTGNHDGSKSGAFELEREVMARYWDNPAHFPGWYPVDTVTNYPFYFSAMEKAGGDIFMVAWDASGAFISDEELEWVRQQFLSPAAQNAKIKLLVGHLPLYGVAQERDTPGNVLANPERLRQMMEEMGVHTYISGHHHAYFPGKRGNVDLLNAGAIGSGPRQWLNSDQRSPNTMTLMDFFFEEDTVVYNTYNIRELNAADMTLFDDQSLPQVFSGINGFTIRRDVEVTGEGQGTLSALNLVEAQSLPGSGDLKVQVNDEGTKALFYGTFSNLQGRLLEDRGAAGIYRALHPGEGELAYALKVSSEDGKNGMLEGEFEIDADFKELLSTGSYYVLLKTTAYPAGEIRSQLYPASNKAPTPAMIFPADTVDAVPVRDVLALLPITWESSTDPENNAVTYSYQLAQDETFETLIHYAATGRATEFREWTEGDWYSLLGDAAEGEIITFYHRVISSDGKNITYSPAQSLKLVKSNEPIEGAVEIPAPEYLYDGVVGIAPATNGHGITVDRDGKIWAVAFSRGIQVYNPDGSAYALTADEIAYNNDDLTSYVSQISFKDTIVPIRSLRGIGTAHDGHILVVVQNSDIFKLDKDTGKPLAFWDGPTSFTNPSSDASGRVFVASVVGNRQFILKQNEADPTTFDVLVGGDDADGDGRPDGFELEGRELARSSFISPEGNRIYLPANSGRNVHVYSSTDGINFSSEEVTRSSSTSGSNSVFAGQDSVFWFVVNRSSLAPNLIYRDFANKLSWNLFLEDVPSNDLRGLTFTTQRDTLYVIGSDNGQIVRYRLPSSAGGPGITEVPTYRISEINGTDSQGEADSVGVYTRLFGVVNSPDRNQIGLNFTLIDSNAGINVFNPLTDHGYVPAPGDSVYVVGSLLQENGLLRIYADSVGTLPGKGALTMPQPVQTLQEDQESLPVTLQAVYVPDPMQWTTGQGYLGFHVEVTDGTRYFKVFIPRQSDLYKQAAPIGKFNLTGIVHQLDTQSPFLSGYELVPRSSDDLEDLMQVLSFTLVNAATGEDIRDLTDQDVIDIKDYLFDEISIRANTNPGTVGSVRLMLSGEEKHKQLENRLPYSLFGDGFNGGPAFYRGWLPGAGQYTLTATPFEKPRGRGEEGIPLTITFSVENNSSIRELVVIDAATQQPLGTLGETIDLKDLQEGTINIVAITEPATVGSVKFQLSGAERHKQTENFVPYALFADNDGEVRAWSPRGGQYELEVTPYSRNLGRGSAGISFTTSFEVINTMEVKEFIVVDDRTNQDLGQLPMVLDLEQYTNDRFNIRAETDPEKVGSVRFKLEGRKNRQRTENVIPYHLFGDRSWWRPEAGTYTLSATPYNKKWRRGVAGITKSMDFQVVEGEVKDLMLVALCSDSPSESRNWQIINPNAFAIFVNWQLEGTSQQNAITAWPGNTSFSTETVGGANKAVITWKDEKGLNHQQESFSNEAACKIMSELSLFEEGQVVKAGQFKIYPNPMEDFLYIELNNLGEEWADIALIDQMTEEVIYQGDNLRIDTNGITLFETSLLKPGIYILKITSGSMTETIRLIKE